MNEAAAFTPLPGPPHPRAWPAYGTLWRWHFYAGLLCIPVVLWLAATGSIYLFKPQIDAWQDRAFANLDLGARQSPSAQVSAALAAIPGLVLYAYQLPTNPRQATQIVVARATQLTRVYVRPDTLKILKAADEDKRFTTLVFHLHGEFLHGDRGSMLVEAAASWTLVLLITGLLLWWPSDTRAAGVLYPRLGLRGRLWWRDLHSVTGFWVTFLTMFLLISGLPWAKNWGGILKQVRQFTAESPLAQNWTTGRSSELEQRRVAIEPPVVADEHAAHHHGAPDPHAAAATVSVIQGYQALDALVPLVSDAGLAPPTLIAPPSRTAPHWSARSETQNRPRREELILDDRTATIMSRSGFGQKPLLDRVVDTGVAAHEGQLFGPANQVLGLVTAVGLWCVCISAVVLWWRRRPAGVLGAPAAVPRPRLAYSVIGLIMLLGILLPLLGASLLIILIAEKTVLRRLPRARIFLGLVS